MPNQRTSRTGSLALSLGIVVVLATFLYESIFSKTAMIATSFVVVFALLALPITTRSFLKLQAPLRGLGYVLPLLCLAGWYLLMQGASYAPDIDAQGTRTSIYIVVMAFAFVCGYSVAQNRRSVVVGAVVVIAVMIVGATWWVRDFNEASLTGFAQTKNVVSGTAMHMCFLAALLTIHRRSDLAYRAFVFAILGCLAIAVIANQRSMTPGAIVALGAFMAASKAGARSFLPLIVFAGFLVIEWSVFSFISQLNYNDNLVSLNNLAREWTGRRINSGREELWHLIAYYLERSPLLGLGTGVLPSDLFSTPLSAHNSFLQLTMQVGFVGLAFLLIQLYTVLCGMRSQSNPVLAAFGVGYFTFAMIHATFEVFLTTNNFVMGSLTWLNFGLLVGLCRVDHSSNRYDAQTYIRTKALG